MTLKQRLTRWSFAAAAAATVAGAGLAPSPALAAETTSKTGQVWHDDAGNRHEVLYDGKIRDIPGREGLVAGSCPREEPYLHEKTGTAGRNVGQGFIVRDDTWGVEVNEVWTKRTFGVRPDGARVVTGTVLRAEFPIWNIYAAVWIEMVCTKNPSEAWRA
jgi:hypothetical protein